MREVVVHWQKPEERDPSQERLVALLAGGLQRLFEQRAVVVDFGADESVTTTCPDDGAGEDLTT